MTPAEIVPLAGQLLLGKRSAADLAEPVQHALLERLLRGKVVLFRARGGADGVSSIVFPGLETPALQHALERERRRCDAQRRALLAAQEVLSAAGIPLVLFKCVRDVGRAATINVPAMRL